MNDLPDVLTGNVLLSDDDVKLFAPRFQYNSTLQNLRAAFKWSEDFDLPLNAGKCAYVSVGGPPPFPLSLADGTAKPIVDYAKDLGVTITADFKVSQHCREAANRARRVLFQMRRGFAVLTPEIFRPLYLALVRPILEYGLQASSPYLGRDVFLMERLQRLGARMVKSLRELSYEDRLRRLNPFTIERRLLRGTSFWLTTYFKDT